MDALIHLGILKDSKPVILSSLHSYNIYLITFRRSLRQGFRLLPALSVLTFDFVNSVFPQCRLYQFSRGISL